MEIYCYGQLTARDILAVPISTVASESAFSTGGRHVSPLRNRLHPKTVEALVFAQDWLWSTIEGMNHRSRQRSRQRGVEWPKKRIIKLVF